MFLPHCQRPSCTPIQNNGQYYSSIYLDRRIPNMLLKLNT